MITALKLIALCAVSVALAPLVLIALAVLPLVDVRALEALP
jgi:hypothetical protein